MKFNGPRGMMSGSRKRLRRNGSTVARESGPPSWKRTMPTRFLVFWFAISGSSGVARSGRPHSKKARVRDDNACPWTTLSRDRSRQWQHTRASLRAGQRIFEAVEFGAEVGGAFGDGEIEHKEYAPTNDVGSE